MSPESPEQKRAAGKSLKQSRIVWQLEVGALLFRCVWAGAPAAAPFTVENRTGQGWKHFSHVKQPVQALRALVASTAIVAASDLAAHRIEKYGGAG